MKKNAKKLISVSDYFNIPKNQDQKTQKFGDGIIKKDQIKISCWNINGLRAILEKGELKKYLNKYNPDICCLSEIKISQSKFDEECIQKQLSSDFEYQYFNFCKPPIEGYSGVAVLSKFQPINVLHDFDDKHNQEGRTLTVEFDKFYLVTSYVPNSGTKLDRLNYRTQIWDKDFNKNLKEKKKVILCGDLNCAHKEIDLTNPKTNLKSPGFTVEEREYSGFIDIFRERNPELKKYSWFSYRGGARAKNIGWRIDYFLIDNQINNQSVHDVQINNEVFGSDHCPVEITLNLNEI